MKELTVNIKGKDTTDLILALSETLRLVEQGFIEGNDKNDTGSYMFEIDGWED